MLRLTLSEAIKTQRLEEFIAKEKSRGVGTANAEELGRAIKILATTRASRE